MAPNKERIYLLLPYECRIWFDRNFDEPSGLSPSSIWKQRVHKELSILRSEASQSNWPWHTTSSLVTRTLITRFQMAHSRLGDLVGGRAAQAVREIRGGAPPDIWMDHALEPNEIVSEALQRLAAESHVLVLIMSRGYLQSRWCQMELKTFLDARAATKNKESVFIVETLPTDRDLWHPRLRSLSQVLFWEQKFEQKSSDTLRLSAPGSAW